MPASLADGPLGLEGRHTFNGITVNDIAGGLPYLKADRITGLHDVADADDPRDQNADQIGETAYPTLLRGKTVVYNGRVMGRTLLEARALATALRAAASSRADMPLAISPHPDLGGPTLTAYGRPIACPIDDEQTLPPEALPTPYQRPFVLSFRLRDPRFFDLSAPDAAGAAAGTPAFLGMTGPVAADGGAPGEPVFTVNGPTTAAVVLRHLGMSLELAFLPALALAGGDILTVDFLARQARVGATDVAGYVDWANSNWWDSDRIGLIPGIAQQVQVDGAGAWTVSAYNAVW